ncbi:Probable cobalt transporter subunit (CbtB) [Parafrankia irregularis]|uniref:Probable cobalt transporter subunit (CbtB) n=1 Tax=Parafrankia irregularis TaxID=795642 RepID=A0A0S4QTB8_9ACTN|nr:MULTISPECIES: CbtB domain-containing protein [Parafrankia]MBE3201795.1 CbtB-domain containing protein [Parafrankia sp. CH37]CUU58274.1 Probable cobalt transporter subunit (CbtB) [Parafrankia irregularis]
MAESVVPSSVVPAPSVGGARPLQLPLREIVPWAVLTGVLMLLVIYFVGSEEGAFSMVGGTWIHEFVHDGRHLLGFPCH